MLSFLLHEIPPPDIGSLLATLRSAMAPGGLAVLARIAGSLTRNAADTDDLVQDTFLKAYDHRHTFVPGSDCRRWLAAICRNTFFMSLSASIAASTFRIFQITCWRYAISQNMATLPKRTSLVF